MGDGDAKSPPESAGLWDPSHDASLQEAVDELGEGSVPALKTPAPAGAAESFSGANPATPRKTPSGPMGEIARSWDHEPTPAPRPPERADDTRPTAPTRRDRAAAQGATIEMADDVLHDAIRRATGPEAAIGTATDDATPPPGRAASFSASFSRYVGIAFAQQLAFKGFLNGAKWNLDLQAGTVTFEGKGTFPVQLLGSVSDSQNTWLWAWANPSEGIDQRAVAHVGSLRSEVPLPEFQRSVVSLDEASGDQLSLTVSGLSGGVPYFRGPFPGGAVYFLVSGLPFGGRPGLKFVPSLVSAILAEHPSVDARLVVDGLLEDLELSRDERGGVVIGRSGAGAVEFEFSGEAIVRSEFRPRPASKSAPMGALKLKQRIVQVDTSDRKEAIEEKSTAAERAARAAAEEAIAAMSAAGDSQSTRPKRANEGDGGDLDEFSGVGDLVSSVTLDTSADDILPKRPAPASAPPPPARGADDLDDFAFPEPVRAETSNAQVVASVAALTASGEARRAAESAAQQELMSSPAAMDGFGAMPPDDEEAPSGAYSAMARADIVDDGYAGPPTAGQRPSDRGVTLEEGFGGMDVDPSASAADFMFSGAAAASTVPAIEPAADASAPATQQPPAGASPVGGMAAITEPPAVRATPGKPVGRPTIGGGLQLATEIHGAIATPESMSHSGGLPVFAPDPEAGRAAEERAAELEKTFPGLSTSGASPVQGASRQADPALADTVAPGGMRSAFGSAAHQIAAETPVPAPAPTGASLPADPTPRIWEEKARAAAKDLPPELDTKPTRQVSGPTRTPSLSRPSPATPEKAPEPEKDLTKLYTMGIRALGVLLILVLLMSLGGGGASARFQAATLAHDEGRDATLTYSFVFDDLPDPPHSIVVHLDSDAFSAPVIVPWNVLTDQQPVEGSSYEGETAIHNVLAAEVKSSDAEVRISVELNGRTVGSERVDIRALYDFD